MAETLYLVTGVNGHLGNTIARKLLAEGCRVRGLALPGDETVSWKDTGMELVRGNICDRQSLDAFFANPEKLRLAVIHTAGLISIASKIDPRVYDVNVNGTRNIVELCIKYNVQKLVYVSSVHAIPVLNNGQTMTEINHFNPDLVKGCYAKTKAQATQIVLDSVKNGLNASVVQPSGITGPGDFGHGHLTQLVVDYTNHSLTAGVEGGYDIVDVRDIADAVINCVKYGRAGECYICSNQYVSVKQIFQILHDATGKRMIKTILPMWFAKLTAPLAETYYRILRQTPLYTSYSLYTLTSNAVFSNRKARTELGFKPRTAAESFRDTASWLKEKGRIKY